MAFTPVKQITVDEKVKKAGFTPLGTVIQDKPKSKGFIGGAISELGSDLAGAGKAIGGLAKAAVNVPIGFGQAVAGGLTFNKELTEKGIQKATAPVRGTGQLIKTAAIDVPKNVGQGLGQFIAGGLQQGAGLISGNEELKEKGEVAQRGGTIQGLKGIGQGASFVPNVAGQALGGLTGSLSESLEKNLSGGEALGRAFMSAGERAALTKGIQKIFNKPRGEKGKPGIREKLTLEEKIPLILEHCRLAIAAKGEHKGMQEMRKHLASYIKGIDGARELRAKLVRVETLGDVETIFTGL